MSGDKTHFQLDPYHRNKALREAGLSREQQASILRHFRKREIDEVFGEIRSIYSGIDEGDGKKRKRLLALYSYYHSNRDALVPILHRGLTLPRLRRGLVYRPLGTMESSIGNLVGRRLKKRKAAWSKAGAENLTRLIGLKLCGEMRQCVLALTKQDVRGDGREGGASIRDVMSAAAVGEVSGKGYLPRSARLPISGAADSHAREAIARLLDRPAPGF